MHLIQESTDVAVVQRLLASFVPPPWIMMEQCSITEDGDGGTKTLPTGILDIVIARREEVPDVC